ncbi:MAG: DUF2207 domain-containing protein [Leifsonia sp.]
MRRPIVMSIAAASLAIGALLPAAVGGPVATASADVDDFAFESFHGDYALDRDDSGNSTLRVTETLVALFPEFDQNRGIRRELVDSYDGHPTDLDVLSVTDERGTPRPYEEETDDGFAILTIAGDDYVHGRQTYVITYTQRNVTKYFSDTDADEFYWDTNGTGWAQPFGSVTASVHLPEDLRQAMTGRVAAASGAEGETGPAEIAETPDGYDFSAVNLQPRENLSFAIGFQPGTFTPRDGSFGAAPWPGISLGFAVIAALAAVWAWIVRSRRLRDAPGRPFIVPEYLPPKDTSLLLAAVITGKTTPAVPAQILALAVSGRVRVVEVDSGRKPSYELEFVSLQATGRDAFRSPEPSADELEFLHAIFGGTLTPGERRPLGKSDSAAVKRLTALGKRVRTASTTDGYRKPYPSGAVAGVLAVVFVAGVAAILFAAVSFATVYGGFWPAVFLAVALAAIVLAVIAVSKMPLEAKGAELRDHLRGLDEYIRLAEADRIRYLQSPQGAERTPIATDDREQLLRLNERLLPWAVLFGREKQWTAELGRYYEENGTQPGWYVGGQPFNAAVFASSVASVTSSASSSYSAASGGSGGGASSGGGGGGGGGGGV